MKKLFKVFIPFIFATLISASVSAVTMNGCLTTAMQGCSPAQNSCDFSQIFGADLIASYDATDASSVTLNGIQAPFIIDDDFSASPGGWTFVNDAVITGGELVAAKTSIASAHAYDDNTDSPQTERWMEYDWTVDAGHTMSAGLTMQGSGIGQNTGNEGLLLGLTHNGGQVKFIVLVRGDSGAKVTTIIDPSVSTFAVDTTYRVVLHYKVATGVGNDDGIVRVWIDNVLVHSETDVDSDTIVLGRNWLGNRQGGAFDITLRFDNYKLSLNGADPTAVTQWADLSGKANHLVQATEADQPFYDSVNLEIDLDGVNEFLQTSTFSSAINQPNDIFIVATVRIDSNNYIFDGITGGDRHALFGSGPLRTLYAGNLISSDSFTSNKTIYLASFNTTSSELIEDGISKLTGNVGAHTLTGLTLGARYNNSAGSFIDMSVNEIFIVNKLTTTAERNQVGNCLEDKHSGTTWTDIP